MYTVIHPLLKFSSTNKAYVIYKTIKLFSFVVVMRIKALNINDFLAYISRPYTALIYMPDPMLIHSRTLK